MFIRAFAGNTQLFPCTNLLVHLVTLQEGQSSFISPRAENTEIRKLGFVQPSLKTSSWLRNILYLLKSGSFKNCKKLKPEHFSFFFLV